MLNTFGFLRYYFLTRIFQEHKNISYAMFVFASLKCLHIVLESYNTFLNECFSLNHSYVNIFFYMTNRFLEKFKK